LNIQDKDIKLQIVRKICNFSGTQQGRSALRL